MAKRTNKKGEPTLYLVKLDPNVTNARGEAKFIAVIGRIVASCGGYRFLPQTTAHKASRKVWPSRNASIPRWTENLGFLVLWEKHELDAAVTTASKKQAA